MSESGKVSISCLARAQQLRVLRGQVLMGHVEKATVSWKVSGFLPMPWVLP